MFFKWDYLNVEAVDWFAINIVAFIFSQTRRYEYVCTVYTTKHPGKPYLIVGYIYYSVRLVLDIALKVLNGSYITLCPVRCYERRPQIKCNIIIIITTS